MPDFRRLADELRDHESERLRGVRLEAVVQEPERGRVWTIPEGLTLHPRRAVWRRPSWSLAFGARGLVHRDLKPGVSGGDFAPPRALAPRTPARLEAICLAAMSHASSARPQALAFAKQLEAWVRRSDPPSRVSLIQP